MFDITQPHVQLYILNLVLALVSGTLIGAERESKGKPAGISTQTLVMGAAVTFTFISSNIGASDPSRIAAQIVSGVGFLGAGIILKSERAQHITNLTTAASIWFSAAIGMALGFNMYVIAIAATVYAMISARIPAINKQTPDDPAEK